MSNDEYYYDTGNYNYEDYKGLEQVIVAQPILKLAPKDMFGHYKFYLDEHLGNYGGIYILLLTDKKQRIIKHAGGEPDFRTYEWDDMDRIFRDDRYTPNKRGIIRIPWEDLW